jgi:hypothetical protein
MGYNVQQDESGTAQFAAPIHGALRQGGIQLFFCQLPHVDSSRFSVFCCQQVGDGWALLFAPTSERLVLQVVNPTFLTTNDVHQLRSNRQVAESQHAFLKKIIRNGCDMVQQSVQSLVRCGM